MTPGALSSQPREIHLGIYPGGEDICEKVKVVPAFYVIDGQQYSVYALPPESRSKFLPSELVRALPSHFRDWCIRQFTVQPMFQQKGDFWTAINKAIGLETFEHSSFQLKHPDTADAEYFAWQSVPPGEQPQMANEEVDSSDDGAGLPEASKPAVEEKIVPLNLPQAGSAVDKTLAIYNADKKARLQLIDPVTGIASLLAPGEASLFQLQPGKDDQCHWKEAVQYKLHDSRKIKSNPLLRECAPIASNREGSFISGQGCQGELFIPVEVVCDLVADKRASHEKPVVCHGRKETEAFLENWRKGSDQAVSFILHNQASEHMLAVRVVRDEKTKHVVCYVNETLCAKSPLAEKLRRKVSRALTNAFPDCNTTLFYNEAIIQRDFSSCGVYTLKGLRFFDKNPDFDRHLITRAEALRKNSGSLLHTEQPVPLREMPPQLLKLYQGKLSDLSGMQRWKTVNQHRIRLKAYIKKHQKALPKTHKPNKTGLMNMAPFRKRYQYLRKWYERHGVEKARKAPLKPASELPDPEERKAAKTAMGKLSGLGKKPPQPPAAQPIDFSPILNEGDLDKINDWIADEHPEMGEFPESGEDWCNIYDFDAYVANTEQIDLDRLQAIRSWATRLMTPEAQKAPRNQLMLQWLNVSKNSEQRWRRRSLKWVLFQMNRLGENAVRKKPPVTKVAAPRPEPMEVQQTSEPVVPGFPLMLAPGAPEQGVVLLIGQKRTSSQAGLPAVEEARPSSPDYEKMDNENIVVDRSLLELH